MKRRKGGAASMDSVPIKIDIDSDPKKSGAQLWQTYIEKVRTQVNEEKKDAKGRPINNGLPKKNDILNGTFAVLVVKEDEMKRMLSPDKTVYPPCSAFDIKIFKKRDKMINSKLKGENDSRIEIINIYDGTEVSNNGIKVSILNGLIEKTGLDPKTQKKSNDELFGDFGEFSCKYYFRIILVSSDCTSLIPDNGIVDYATIPQKQDSILQGIIRYAKPKSHKPVPLTKDAMRQKQGDDYYTLLTGYTVVDDKGVIVEDNFTKEELKEEMTKLGISRYGKLNDYIKKDKIESKEELNPTRFMGHCTQFKDIPFTSKIKTIIQESIGVDRTATATEQATEPVNEEEPATAANALVEGGRRKSKRFKKRSKKRSTRRRFRSKK
jgi:hypothetical protein